MPVEKQACVRVAAGDDGGEDDEDEGDGVVGGLEGDDLGEDAEGREVGQGAWAGWAATAGHSECYREGAWAVRGGMFAYGREMRKCCLEDKESQPPRKL